MGFTRISWQSSTAIGIILILFVSFWVYPETRAQNNTSFSPADQFLIPSNNGAVNFGVNGTYSNATLENGSWAFTNLSINGSTTLQNFFVSAKNSNITIFTYFSSNNTIRILILRYTVEGNGKQSFNFGLGHINEVDWTIIKTIDRKNVFLTPGVDYTFSPNGTIVVNGATGNFSIAHYNFYNTNSLNSKLPFYEQHSVALTTSTVTVIVIVLAAFLAVRNRKNDNKFNGSTQVNDSKKPTLKDKEQP